MALYVVRHGETEWNVERRLQGRKDSALTQKGLEQAESYGRLLRLELAGVTAVHLCASPLPRARQTASILREMLGVANTHYSESDLLMERAAGAWEGMQWDDIEARYGVDARSRWRHWDACAADEGESLAQVHARAKAWLSLSRTLPTVVVTHGVTSRILRGAYLGLDAAATMALESHDHEMIFALHSANVRTLRLGSLYDDPT